MRKLLRFVLDEFEAIAGILAAFTALFLHYIHAIESVALPLSTVLISLLFLRQLRREHVAEERVRTSEEMIKAIHAALADRASSCAEVEELLRVGLGEFGAERMPAAWLSLLWRVKESYQATNYMDVASLYPKGFATAALAAQKAKRSAENVMIRKIFIVDHESELAQIRETLLQQIKEGMEVRFMLHSEMRNTATTNPALRSVETIDFTLFDSRVALLWFLDKKRALTGGRVLIGSEVQNYKTFFDALLREAKIYT